MNYLHDKWKMLMHPSYRRAKKWREMNPDNFTTLKEWYSRDYVHVGKMTYGEINARRYGKNDGQLYIGSFCSIASNVSFHLSGNHHMETLSTYPVEVYCFDEEPDSLSKGDIVVGDDVWIGYNAIILSGVHIGQGAVIAAGAVVTKDIPPYAIAGGVPAKVLKYRFSKEIRDKLIHVDYSKIDKEFIRGHKDIFIRPIDKQIYGLSNLPQK